MIVNVGVVVAVLSFLTIVYSIAIIVIIFRIVCSVVVMVVWVVI